MYYLAREKLKLIALQWPKCKYPLGSGGNLDNKISPKFFYFHSLVSLVLTADLRSLATKLEISRSKVWLVDYWAAAALGSSFLGASFLGLALAESSFLAFYILAYFSSAVSFPKTASNFSLKKLNKSFLLGNLNYFSKSFLYWTWLIPYLKVLISSSLALNISSIAFLISASSTTIPTPIKSSKAGISNS